MNIELSSPVEAAGSGQSMEIPMVKAFRPDGQSCDAITIETIPRYKKSKFSGDMWRISARLRFRLKGKTIYKQYFGNVSEAALHCASLLALNGGSTISPMELCDQEGCAQPSVVTYRVRNEYDRQGFARDPQILFPNRLLVRSFCETHRIRGDCALEDADSNYEEVN